jgi:hypothetical protein
MSGSSRFTPSARAARYQTILPSIAPAVPHATTSGKLIFPSAAAMPATGMITSDGIGGKIVSRNIRKPTPR